MTSPQTIRLGLDIGGTFTDVALEVGERRFTAKTLTTSGAPEDGVLAALRAVIAEAGIAPRPGQPHHPRHHARHQRDHRAQGRQDRAADHRGFSRRGRDPPREPVRAVRRQHRPAAAAGAAPAAAAGARADRRAGQRAGAARCRKRRARDRHACGAERRGGGGRPPAQLHQPGSRAPHRRGGGAPPARRRGDAVVRRLARDARVRALLHRLRQRLHPAADGALPRRSSRASSRAPASPARSC